jgi:hypothetical protein
MSSDQIEEALVTMFSQIPSAETPANVKIGETTCYRRLTLIFRKWHVHRSFEKKSSERPILQNNDIPLQNEFAKDDVLMAQVDAFNQTVACRAGSRVGTEQPSEMEIIQSLSCDQFLAVHQIYRVSRSSSNR